MTTELLQNLIPTTNQGLSSTKTETKFSLKDDAFSGLLDSANAKYSSKESVANNQYQGEQKNIGDKNLRGLNQSDKNNAEFNADNKKEALVNGVDSEIKSTVNDNAQASQNQDVNKNETSQNTEDVISVEENPDEVVENSEVKEDDAASKNDKIVATLKADTNIKLSENILNNLILGHSMTKNSDDETEEGKAASKENIDEISNIEDTMLNVLDELQSTIQVDCEMQNDTQAEVVSKTEVAVESVDIDVDKELTTREMSQFKNDVSTNSSSEKIINSADLAIKSNDTLESLKQTNTPSLKDENSLFVSEDVLVNDEDLLVKVDEVIESSVDDLVNELSNEVKKSDINSESKLSQDVIEDLDVTVKSVVYNDKQKGLNENGQNFNFAGNHHGNAQENIIKMSIKSEASDTNVFEYTDVSKNLTEGNDILLNRSIDFNPKSVSVNTMTTQSIPQNISDAEILSQINSKLTLPQENTVNKVNIILQPEQLGKVSVEIMQTKDGIVAKMIADTVQVKDLLDKSIESLKNTLASQGVNVNNISVKVEESSAAQNAGFGFEQEQFNREAANQSHQNQQSNSGNSENYDDKNSLQNSEESEKLVSDVDAVEENIDEPALNDNGSISIMV